MSNRKKELKKKDPRGSKFFRFAYSTIGWVFRAFFNMRVVNREKEPPYGGYVVCANHVSAVDPIVVCLAFRQHQVHFMAKKELFKIPLLAPLIRSLGAFPVDRGGNDVGAVKHAVNIVSSGCCLGIFPQGHRYVGVDPRDTKTKNGAALITARVGAPVVPVYIWRKNNKMKLFGKTYVIIGDAIPFEEFEYSKDESGVYARMTDKIFDRVCTLGEGFDPKEYKKNRKSSK